jgi:glycosyltransferase involved in cell wall biosynthesis
MQKLSVVIICKNEAEVIGLTLLSFNGLTDDMVVYDNGSTDNTQEKVKQAGANLYEGSWEGFGKTKNKANALARYDWILSLDADEAINEELKNNLLQLHLADETKVYELKFKNFLGNKWLRFGEWGTDKHIRLFNRKRVIWNEASVHEALVFPEGYKMSSLKGYVLHKTASDLTEYKNKMRKYAELNAKEYFRQGKKGSGMKLYLSPAFSFIKNYFFKLGFLDGREGFSCARISALYTFLKYKKLSELNKTKSDK